jgi:hypothetical protein
MKRGVHAVLYAFFGRDEELDRAAMRRQATLCRETRVVGIAGLMAMTEKPQGSIDSVRRSIPGVSYARRGQKQERN